MQKKIIFIGFFLTFFLNYSIAEIKFNIKVSPLEIKKKSTSQYSLSFSVSYNNLHKDFFNDSTVPIPVEEIIIDGTYTNYTIKEYDFLYAGLNFDINGDKDFKDSFTLKFYNNHYYFDKVKLSISAPLKKIKDYSIFKYYDEKGNKSLNKIGSDSKAFIIYYINNNKKRIIIGMNRSESPIEIKEFSNPNVQIILFKPVEDINKKVNFSIGNAKNFYAFSNEKIIEGYDNMWNGISWVVLPLDINKNKKNSFSINLNNVKTPFSVMVFPNLSIERGMRVKMNPVIKIIK